MAGVRQTFGLVTPRPDRASGCVCARLTAGPIPSSDALGFEDDDRRLVDHQLVRRRRMIQFVDADVSMAGIGGLEGEGSGMPAWDAATWWTAVGSIVGIVALAVGLLAWLRPVQKGTGRLNVVVTNDFPVFNQLDGSRTVGDHLVGVTLRNPTGDPVKVTGWGLRFPSGRTLRVFHPQVAWDPPLPYVVPPCDSAMWHLDPHEVRRASAKERVPFDKMHAFVNLADGRTIMSSRRGVPLAD